MQVVEAPAPVEHYCGALNAEPKKGKSGAGTDWENPNGHAFIRRGSGIPMSQRASRHAQMTGASKELIAKQSAVAAGERASSRDSRLPPGAIRKSASRERSAMSRDCDSPADPFPAAQRQGGYSNARPPRGPSR